MQNDEKKKLEGPEVLVMMSKLQNALDEILKTSILLDENSFPDFPIIISRRPTRADKYAVRNALKSVFFNVLKYKHLEFDRNLQVGEKYYGVSKNGYDFGQNRNHAPIAKLIAKNNTKRDEAIDGGQDKKYQFSKVEYENKEKSSKRYRKGTVFLEDKEEVNRFSKVEAKLDGEKSLKDVYSKIEERPVSMI